MQTSTEHTLLDLMEEAFQGRSRVYQALLDGLEEHLDPAYAEYVLHEVVTQLRITPAGFQTRHATAFLLEYLPRYLAHVPTDQSRWVCHDLWSKLAEHSRLSVLPPRAP